jgi:agmatinase
MTESESHRHGTLFGWPDAAAGLSQAGRLCVIGVRADHGNAISRGAAHAPEAIRRASLRLAAPRTSGFDWGDVEGANATDLVSYLHQVTGTVERIFRLGMRPLTLGGDHSISYAPVLALQRTQNICLIWFDAHTDYSPWAGQEFHNHKQVLRRISRLEGVQRIVQIGYRGITVGDERRLSNRADVITTARARQLDGQALLSLLPSQLPCYVSIDIDVVDPFWAPGTSAPVPGGLLPEQIRTMLVEIVRNRTVLGVDLVEVNPLLDSQGETALIAAELIREMGDHWSFQVSRA